MIHKSTQKDIIWVVEWGSPICCIFILLIVNALYIYNNEKEHLRIFNEKVDAFLGYSLTSKAFRLVKKMIMVVEESIHAVFDEPMISRNMFINMLMIFKLNIKLNEESYVELVQKRLDDMMMTQKSLQRRRVQ